MRYLEDYQVGEVERFGRYEVTREEMLAFARRYDPQPFHLDDEEAAKSLVFERMAASGWHTASMTMAMQVAAFEAGEPPFIAALGIEDLRWHTPVYAGDVLTCERTILEVRISRSRPEAGVLRMRTTTRNQSGQAVMALTGVVLVKRRIAAAGADEAPS